jgi:hypothetical protein
MIALMFKAEMMMTEEVVLDNYKLSGVPGGNAIAAHRLNNFFSS